MSYKQKKTPPNNGSKPVFRVAVLVDTSTSWGRSIHQGIHDYDRKHGKWQLFVEAHGLEERLRVPSGWNGDGVIARVPDFAMAEDLKKLRIPVVNVSGIQLPKNYFPCVTTDLIKSANLAAQHFFERGFKHFAYFSIIGLPYIASHQKAFANTVIKAGKDFNSFAVKPMAGADPDWNLDLAKLGNWLKSLPKPVGILTWNPSGAREIIYACQMAHLLVPEEVAVLSGSDDDLLCELLQIPVSGIIASAKQIGHKAAEMLDRVMNGDSSPQSPVRIAPKGITARQSTDTLAISDPALVKALSFIRQGASQPIQVNEIARNAGISRRMLERRFMQILGRSPASEIRRIRFERAKCLLTESDMPIPDVAEASAFGSPEYLAYIFRQEIGMSPLKFRQHSRKM